MLPCSTSPAVVPAAAATAAAAAVTEAGAVVCLLPTVKSPIASHVWRKRVTRQGRRERGEQWVKMEKWWSDILKEGSKKKERKNVRAGGESETQQVGGQGGGKERKGETQEGGDKQGLLV